MSSNPLSFSVYWADNYNTNGVNPPNPQFKKQEAPSYIMASTLLPSTSKNGLNPVGLIQSNREPYAVENMFTSYGNLNTRVGTNMGM